MKKSKKSKNTVKHRIVYNSLCVRMSMCVGYVGVFEWVIFAYCCVWAYKWYLVYVRMKIHTQRDKFEVVSRMWETLYVAEFATEWPRKFLKFVSLYICMRVCGDDFN